ncbi:YkgJ family cysteine cluster protein [Desulfogranum japonicum]|uniref:YkgJ family cysteine cluster protein n=1 Tax=Desulfogranum japonicum TaxID=231447 RepID=UPI000406324A|nr:YkgJ family cysteine cluster protein [Desulfogranum japonicum]
MVGASGCKRCGECCLQGGPALHTQDLELVRNGHIVRNDLVTVRKGELALQPLEKIPQPVEREFLKVRGSQGQWRCLYYDQEQSTCSRYRHRPLACRLLECAEPEPLLAITGKDLVSRFDLIAADEPILPYIREHEKQCACPFFQEIQERLDDSAQQYQLLQELEELVNLDIRYRSVLQNRFQFTVGLEMFYLGRPIFQLLSPLGIVACQENDRMKLTCGKTT